MLKSSRSGLQARLSFPMNCCTQYSAAEAHFGAKIAERDLQGYRRRGAQGITKILLQELRRLPLEGKELLDVGGGIGIIAADLADVGLASVTLVEASPSYLEAARKELETRYASRRAQFLLGDFSLIASTVPGANLVTLDRVVCCYPDDAALLRAAAKKTHQVLALTYPRDRWYVRAAIAMENALRRAKGDAFRAFVHPEQRLGATLEAEGLVRFARRETFSWALDLYRRN
jgi:magnesium-protoporphyrin O-methyltransferase